MDIVWTNEQLELFDRLIDWYYKQPKQWFSYSGAAGTGKTTVIKEFINRIGLDIINVACAAYTGKAVMVLSQNGLHASTIHSLIYYPLLEDQIDDDGNLIKGKNGKVKKHIVFHKRDELKAGYKLIVIDEASMVNDMLRDEILSFGIPTIFIGDHNQLPPIFGVSSVMIKPDFILTKIMRQAEKDPIVYLSQMILNGETIYTGQYGISEVVQDYYITKDVLTDYGIIICGKNATREKINTDVRVNILGRSGRKPAIGDKVICRQNNWEKELRGTGIYLTNGLVGYLEEVDYSTCDGRKVEIDFRPEFTDKAFHNLKMDYRYIRLDLQSQKEYGMSRFEKFEYGYCITAHLSQGSQYENVLFFDESFYDSETTMKLRYTAITRARTKITIVAPYGKLRY